MNTSVIAVKKKCAFSWSRVMKSVNIMQLEKDNGTAIDIKADKYFQDKVAVITGASSGIGKELAYQLAAKGAIVDICSRSENKLATVVEAIKKAGLSANYHIVDVSKEHQVNEYAANIINKYGKIDIAVNNAGIGLGGLFLEIPLPEIERLFSVNLWGTIYGTKAFLPHLCKQRQSHLVNISSIGGMIGVAGFSPYNMTKFAVRGLTESLQKEYHNIPNINISGVYPGYVKTDIMDHTKIYTGEIEYSDEDKYNDFDKCAITSVEKASRIIIKGIKKGKKRIIVGADAIALDYMSRIAPVKYQKLFIAAFRLRCPAMYKAYYRFRNV